MFNCIELEDYLSTPIRERTKEQRSKAYIASYDMLIDWFLAFQDRNAATPITSFDVTAHINSLIDKRNSFLL